MNDPPPADDSIFKHMLRGSAWALLMRAALRGIGMVSTVVLARLLTPDDFGLVAMGSVVIGFLETSSQVGVGVLLIRQPKTTRDLCDTGWTIQLLQGLFIALGLVFAAPLASRYFEDPRLTAVMDVFAASILIGGASNIGIVLFRKELDFAKDFRFLIYARLAKFVVTVPLAFALRTYWALAIGALLGNVLSVILSYVMHPYRPRLSLARARDFWSLSLFMVPYNLGAFLNTKVHLLVLGRIASAPTVGAYHIASELSSMASLQITSQIGRALFPSYAKLTHDLRRLVEVFLHVLATASILLMPMGIGLSAVAEDFVEVFLGSQWSSSVPLVRWLAFYGIFLSLGELMTGRILLVTGHERLSATVVWVRLGLLVPAIVVAGFSWGVEPVAIAATGTSVLMMPIAAYSLTKVLPVTWGQIANALWRPAFAAAIMAVAIQWFHGDSTAPAILTLPRDVAIGVVAYVTVLLTLWWVSGRPAGPERAALTVATTRLRGRLAD